MAISNGKPYGAFQFAVIVCFAMIQLPLSNYEQIVNQLKNAIVTGQLQEGEALPSIRALAADLSVSVITAKRAYEELEKEGLIRSVAGKGFFVCEYNTDYLKEKQLMMIEKHLGENGSGKTTLQA